MKPIPVAFHIGPLELHTYGLGLAIAFYLAYRFLVAVRVSGASRPTGSSRLGIWVVVSAIFGARLFHVLTNLSAYRSQPLAVFEVWHGGLASYGGLLFAVPTALWVAHRHCPKVGVLEGLDIAVPPLALGWCVGRLLGPQLMVAGGGHVTTQWFGMYYAGQVGKRIPVPIIQSIEDGLLLLVLLLVERRLTRLADAHPGSTPPRGALTAIAMVVWGLVRSLDERLWLGQDGHLGSLLVQVAGVALAIGGLVVGVRVLVALAGLRGPPRCAQHSGPGAPRRPVTAAVESPPTPVDRAAPGALDSIVVAALGASRRVAAAPRDRRRRGGREVGRVLLGDACTATTPGSPSRRGSRSPRRPGWW